MPTAKSQTLSIGLHVAFVALVLLLTSRSLQIPPPLPILRRSVQLAPYRRSVKLRQPRAGGSNQTALPARHGEPPPMAHRTFIPPAYPPEPKLALPVTINVESPNVQMDARLIGNPLSKLPHGALGMDGENGIGDHGCCAGVGEDRGGPPGTIGGSARFGRSVTPPVLIDKIEPEFSEQARKAKYQGVVVLMIEVDTTGHPRALRILQRLGLGLDEKAVEAVSKWRFRPGMQDGKPVVTTATVEVSFRLL